MKNITISLEDDLYRRSRISAAESDTTVTALVREFLSLLTQSTAAPPSDQAPQDKVLAVIEKMRKNHPNFQTENRLTRDALHARS